METNEIYFNRELSWLSFNYRVLEEAKDTNLPLYERIKFLAIYSSNLDEFYKVRVANLRNLIVLSKDHRKILKFNPEIILEQINNEVKKQREEYEQIFTDEIIPELANKGIILYQDEKLEKVHLDFLDKYFYNEVFPYLQPMLLLKGAVLSFLQDNVIYLAINLFRKSLQNKPVNQDKINYAILKIPTSHVPRFVELPQLNGKHLIMFLDDVIRLNFDKIFPGYIVDSSYCIKLSRDADLNIDDEFSGNLIEKITKSLSKRKTGIPSRFLFDRNIPYDMLQLLKQVFKLSQKDFFPDYKYHNFSDFFKFPNPLSPELENETITPLPNKLFENYSSIFDAIKENDIMLHFPYNNYNYVLRFLNEAALDSKVEEIKITQYRVAPDSAVVRSLITAAMNGKKVTVFVEVKARFDEETNLKFADQMRKSGINVIASLPGLKVHAKAALVIRKSSSKPNNRRSYAFISTGNFNEKTAKMYADDGLFTSNDNIIEELKKLFTFLEHPYGELNFKNLLVPKFNLLDVFFEYIDREIENVKKGLKGYLLFKMNGLEEQNVIDKLYEASQKGVEIDLIVRGICCIRADMPYSKNIRVTRLVDKYLEHSRIFIFYNNGSKETYISSADLMNRNLHRRIELVTPIYAEHIKKRLWDILQIQLQDNTKGCYINSNMQNIRKTDDSNKKIRAQIEIYNYLKNYIV